jgi:NAD(P)-dependent dehydrogenase (short-subunit alcohol dehydrogenase family)
MEGSQKRSDSVDKRLRDKVALITGGTSGIGEATVDLFASHGALVAVVGRDQTRGEAIAARHGERARFIRADVSMEADIRAAVDHTVAAFGGLDILFNNAGGLTKGGIEDITTEDFRAGTDLLLGSVVFGMKHAVPHMRAKGWGRVINNASVAGQRGDMGQYLYSAAKAAVAHITRMAGLELAKHGITVNAISPGGIATPIFYGGSQVADTLDAAHNEAKMRKLTGNLANATPALRSGHPIDIANAALFLASDEGAFVNCHDLVVDAGMIAGGRTFYGARPA